MRNHWCGWLLGWLLLISAALPAAAGQNLVPRQPAYQPITFDENADVAPAALDHLIASLRKDGRGPHVALVVMVHGFNTSTEAGRKQYRIMGRTLQEEGAKIGLQVAPIGVHWPSSPGPMYRWLPKMLGYRMTAELGFRNAVRNPYLTKVTLARRTGRLALRKLFFRLRADYPAAPIHVLAHSMGSEMLVRALAPEGVSPDPTAEPGRILSLDVATLAGADLDYDVFTPEEPDSAQAALSRARVWWVTVPGKGVADAVLELRRSAGRRDAVGNRGLELARSDFERLMERRALVLDNDHVPIQHEITDYYDRKRMHALALTYLYLQDPTAPRARNSVLAAIQLVCDGETPGMLEPRFQENASVRLYNRWRRNPEAVDYGPVEISAPDPEATLDEASAARHQNRHRRAGVRRNAPTARGLRAAI